MIRRPGISSISAFSLFEVMMVLAITGILITIITVSLNRFNEQLKITNTIQEELNRWYRVRSILWKDLFHSDSIRMKDQEIFLYHSSKLIGYKVDHDSLYRKDQQNDWTSCGIMIEEISSNHTPSSTIYSFVFPWKNDQMILSYPDKNSLQHSINSYFNNYDNGRRK